MKFYDNKYQKLYTFNSSKYREWCQVLTIRHTYKTFVELLKKALLDEDLNNSFIVKSNSYQLGKSTYLFNDSFYDDYAFNFDDVRRHYKKYGKPYSLTTEAYDVFRYEPRAKLLSLAGIIGEYSFIPYLREIALHDRVPYLREKAICSLFDIGSPQAVFEGFDVLLLKGITETASQSSILCRIDELYDFKFSSANENLVPIFEKFCCGPVFATGIDADTNIKKQCIGENLLRTLRHMFIIGVKIGTKKSIQFIIEFGLHSPFVDIQAIAQTALFYAPKKLRKELLILNVLREIDEYNTRRLAIYNLNKGSGKLFANSFFGGLVVMKW